MLKEDTVDGINSFEDLGGCSWLRRRPISFFTGPLINLLRRRIYRYTSQREESRCKPDRLRRLIENRDISNLVISEDDLIIKLIAIVQIIWFVI